MFLFCMWWKIWFDKWNLKIQSTAGDQSRWSEVSNSLKGFTKSSSTVFDFEILKRRFLFWFFFGKVLRVIVFLMAFSSWKIERKKIHINKQFKCFSICFQFENVDFLILDLSFSIFALKKSTFREVFRNQFTQ